MRNGLWILLAGLIFSGPVANATLVSARTDSAITDSLREQKFHQDSLRSVQADSMRMAMRVAIMDSLREQQFRQDSLKLVEMNRDLQQYQDSLTAVRQTTTASIRWGMTARTTADLQQGVAMAESLLSDQLRRLRAQQATLQLTHKVDELGLKALEDARTGSLVEQEADLAARNMRHREQLGDLDRMASAEAERIRVERAQQSLERETKRLRSDFNLNPYLGVGVAGGASSSEKNAFPPAVMAGAGVFSQWNSFKTGAGIDTWGEIYPGPGPNGENGLNWWGGATLCYPIIYEPRGFQSWVQIGARFTANNWLKQNQTLEAVVGIRLKANSWGLTFRVIPQNERIVELGLELSLPPQ